MVFVLGRGDFVVKRGVRSITLIESKYIYIHECILYRIFIYIHVILPIIFMVNYYYVDILLSLTLQVIG